MSDENKITPENQIDSSQGENSNSETAVETAAPVKQENQQKQPTDEPFKPWGMDEHQFCTLMHVSQFVFPFLAVIMWASNKQYSSKIDEHGKVIINWMLSCMIYYIASAILTFVFIGIITMAAVAVCQLIFTIMGTIKASNGEVYKYPLSIPFVK